MDPLLVQETVPARVADVFVFRRVAPDRYAHVGGLGRGDGWAGIVCTGRVAGDALPRVGEARCAWSDEPERRFGPYWSRFSAEVRVSHDVVVVFGGDERVRAQDADWVTAASRLAAHVTEVSPAKRLADELELLHAVRDVALIPPGGVDDVGRELLRRLAGALSCEVGGLLLPDGTLMIHVDDAAGLDEGLVRLALRSLVLQHRDEPACQQDARDAVEGGWLRSYLVRPTGDGTTVVLAHTSHAPRGFTELCQQLADSTTTAAATVLRAARQFEVVPQRAAAGSAEARSDALTGLGNRRAWDEAIAPVAPELVQPVVGEILRALLHLPPARMDEGIHQALATLGQALRLDRVHVFRIDEESCASTHEWCAPGITLEIDNLREVPLDVIAPWMDSFVRDEPVAVADVASLPDAQADLRELLQAQDIQSLLALPMVFEGEVVGFVGFDAVRSRRSFDEAARGLLGSVADVLAALDARRQASQRVERAESRTAELLRHSRDHVFLIDEEGRIMWASQSFHLLGESPEGLTGRTVTSLTHPEDVELVQQLIATWLRSGARSDLTLPDHRSIIGGQTRWMSIVLRDARTQPGIEGLIVAAHDVTHRRTQTERLRHLALHDDLTELPNRALLKDRLEVALHRAARNGGRVGVLFLGLDGFKLVNDSRSHAVGDELLRQIADRLRGTVQGAETAGRFGGDQFVVVMEVDDPEEVHHAVDRMIETFDTPFTVTGRPQTVSASFGLRIADAGELDPDAVLRDADNALFAAKARSRGQLVAFDPGMRERAVRHDEVGRRLPAAIAAGHVRPHYQPLVELETGRVLGVEALARWTDDELGDVGPAEFIPVAEQAGLIQSLGTHVLRTACRDAASWPDDTYVSVNLSPSQLEDADLCAVVGAALDTAGLDPARLVLEVTESLLMRDTVRAAEVLEQLRGMGVRIALDDFGTGHSSLSVLGELPLDMLKIDRSFVTRMLQDDRGARMVDGIVSLAEDLGLLVVAEGVETDRQAARLRSTGCQVAQGWLFGHATRDPDFAAVGSGAA